MSEKKRGGAGRGQGRKPKTDGDKLVKRQVFLRPDQIKFLSGENLSVAVRAAIDRKMTEERYSEIVKAHMKILRCKDFLEMAQREDPKSAAKIAALEAELSELLYLFSFL